MRIAVAMVVLALGGCSVLAGSGRDHPIACLQADAGVNPCEGVFGEDQTGACVGGFCQPVNLVEVCDGIDNDFDGQIDEDLDADGDGYTGCLTGPGEFDCLDTNPDIHPPGLDGFPDEVCDGADNDCDGMTDEMPRGGEALCPAMQLCYPDRGGCDFIDCRDAAVPCPMRFRCDTSRLPAECVVIVEDCTVDGCMGAQRCDTLSRMCTDPLPIGAPCTDDVLCSSTHCYSVGALEIDPMDVGGASRICSAPCCSNTDCAADAVCWAPGSGARGCIPRSIIRQGPFGDLMSVPCTTHGTCPGGRCIGQSTAAYRDNELILTACGDAVGGRSPGASCTASSECNTGLCIGTVVGWRCTEPCGQAEDCPDPGFITFDVCSYVAFAIGAGDTDYIQVCSISNFLAFPPLRGDRDGCSDNTDCREGACLDSACAKTCCADSQCGSDRSCRPVSINGRWEMHCVP